MKELPGQSDIVNLHVNLGEGQYVVVPVNRQILARNLRVFGLKPGQADFEKAAGIERMQGDALAAWVSIKEAFPNFSDFVKHLSHQTPQAIEKS